MPCEGNETTMNNETLELVDGDIAAEKPKQELTMDKLGCFNQEGKFFLKSGSHRKIFTHFKNLYIHRVQHQGTMKKYSKNFV